MDHQLIKTIKDNWLRASQNLGFEIICPFEFNFNHKNKSTFAFLPHYGSENGMIFDVMNSPEFNVDDEIAEWARVNKLYFSFVNIEFFTQYDEKYFIDTLKDWGKYK